MSETTVADLYDAGLARLLDLGSSLAEGDGAEPTAACPGWTVRDVYCHLAGACADVLDGRVEGAGSDEWTARQVAERSGRSFADVVAEYAEVGPPFVEALRTFPIERLAVDQWSHEQDVRGAVGRPGSRDVPVLGWTLDFAFGGLDRARRKRGLPALLVRGSTREWAVGEGEPVATLATSDFELARGLLGRRSPAQLRSWVEPGGDPSVVDAIPFFGPRPDDLVE